MSGVITISKIRVVGGLAIIFIVLALWLSQTSIRRDDIPGFNQAGLALQLSGSAEVVKKAVGEENSPDRELLKTSIRRDCVFILSYASFFVALGLLLSRVRTTGAVWFGVASAVFMLAAAGFDFVENYRAWHILSLSSNSITDSLCSGVRQVSLCKWLFFFLAIGLQSVILIKLMNWYSLIGVGLFIGAIPGLAGLRCHELIQLANIVLGLPVIGLVVVLLVIPRKFRRFFS